MEGKLARRTPMRWVTVLPVAAVGAVIVFLALVELGWAWPVDKVGVDYHTYIDATSRWLGGGSFYAPYQLSGPYEVRDGSILYPPYSLLLFAPFTVLPSFFWWAIPLGATAWAVWANRPSLLGWALIAIAALTPLSVGLIIAGNPVMGVLAAFALGTRYRWPAVGVLLKPTLAPFALFGVRNRRWWCAIAAVFFVALAFLPLWPDYVTALRNASGWRVGIMYSLGDVSLMLIPLAAYLTRRENYSEGSRPGWRAP